MAAQDITKLPQWAQQHIRTLEHNVEHWKKKATAGPEDSNTFIRNYIADDTPLGDSPRIAFRPGGDEFTVYIVNDYLRVEARHGALHVIPSASNSIHLRVGDY